MRTAYSEIRSQIENSNVTPVWLLAYWRLVQGEASGDFAAAWRALPSHLQCGVRCPEIEEAAAILVLHRLVR